MHVVCLVTMFVVWQLLLDTRSLSFLLFLPVTEPLTSCRVVVVAMLKNCRLPSSTGRSFQRKCKEVAGLTVLTKSKTYSLMGAWRGSKAQKYEKELS